MRARPCARFGSGASLEIGRDFECCQGLAQIVRHRLAQRQKPDRLLFDLLLEDVDAQIRRNRLLGKRRVAPQDRFNGVRQLRFAQATHLNEAGAQRFELVLE